MAKQIKVMEVKEAAQITGAPISMIYNMIRSKRLTSVRYGNRVTIPENEYKTKNTIPVTPPAPKVETPASAPVQPSWGTVSIYNAVVQTQKDVKEVKAYLASTRDTLDKLMSQVESLQKVWQ